MSLNGEREISTTSSSKWKEAGCRNAEQEEEDEDEKTRRLMGSPETVFMFPQPSPAAARGPAEAGATESAVLFPVDKIKDACVAVLGRGRQGVRGVSNCLLLLSLQAYWWHFNPVEIRIVPVSMFLCQDFCIQLYLTGQCRCSMHTAPHYLQQLLWTQQGSFTGEIIAGSVGSKTVVKWFLYFTTLQREKA